MKKLILLLCLISSQSVIAWVGFAFTYGGDNWIIVCSDWSIHTYHGSYEGLDIVVPELCPSGVISVEQEGMIRHFERTFSNSDEGPGYPPHGYPCPDCKPCPNQSPGEFCSTISTPAYEKGSLVWSLKKYSPEEQNFMKARYGIR